MQAGFYQAVLQQSPMGYAYHRIICDQQGVPSDYEFLEVNTAFEEMVGLQAAEIIGRRVSQVLPGIRDGEFDWVANYGKIALEGGQTEIEQYAEPLQRWYRIFVYSPQRGYFITLFSDITKEMGPLTELGRFFWINPDLLCIADLDGRFLKVNRSFEKILGFAATELEKMQYLDLVHPEDMAATLGVVAQLSAQEQVVNFINRCRCRDGSYRYLEWQCQPYGNRLYAAARDITRNRVDQEALRVSESRMARAQSISQVGNWELDLGEKRIWASQEAFRIYGVEQEDPYFSLAGVQSMVVPDDRPMMDQALQALIREGQPYDVEFRIIRPCDGAERIINSRAEVERCPDGRPGKVLGVLRDITESKRTEQALAAIAARHLAMIANISDVIAICAADGQLQYVSPNIEKIFGWRAEEIMGTDVWKRIHPGDLERIRGELRWLMEIPGRKKTVEYRFRCRDNSYRDIELTGVNMVDNPNINGLLVNYHDITQRKTAAQSLQESEEKYRGLFEYAGVGIAYFRADGTVISINRHAAGLMGGDPAAFLGKAVEDVFPPDIAVIFRQRISAVAASGRLERYEDFFRLEEGGKWVLSTFNRIAQRQGETTGIQIIIQDITDNKIKEREILYLNNHDLLTGLYNRVFYEDERKRLDVPGELPLSVIVGDVNGLKLINDAFGHSEGDKLLVAMGAILRKASRNEDIVVRMGGDEFCILLPQTNEAEAQAITRRIYQACDDYHLQQPDQLFFPSIALGHATKNRPEDSMEAVLKEAEEFMYRRKLLERKSIRNSVISSIKTTMFEKSHETEAHAERLVALSRILGHALQLSDEQLNELDLFSTLHDIGKVSVDYRILLKPDSLTEAEWQEMRKHPEVGYRIAQASPELVPIADYILCHHERWDGQGYPQGIVGESIPLLSRILAIVDAYDAMTQDRPYRKALSKDTAMAEISRHSGTQFDPRLAELFIREMQHWDEGKNSNE